MKGFDDITWAFVQIAIILVVVGWTINPIYKSIDLAQQNSAKLNAQEIAGIINSMKAGKSDNILYTASLPPSNCRFEINDRFVKVEMNAGNKKQTAIVDIIQTPTKVVSNEQSIDCNKRSIRIEKKGGIIEIN